MAKADCSVCGLYVVYARGRCRTCWRYWLSHDGRDRTPQMIQRAVDRNEAGGRPMSVAVFTRHALRRRRALDAYGGRCVCCGEANSSFLVFDHIYGGGNQHRREIGQNRLVDWLIEQRFPPEVVQILCANCNMAKTQPGGCPHRWVALARAIVDKARY